MKTGGNGRPPLQPPHPTAAPPPMPQLRIPSRGLAHNRSRWGFREREKREGKDRSRAPSHLAIVDSIPQGADGPGALHPGADGRRRQAVVEPLAGQQVGEIEAAGTDPHRHLPGSGATAPPCLHLHLVVATETRQHQRPVLRGLPAAARRCRRRRCRHRRLGGLLRGGCGGRGRLGGHGGEERSRAAGSGSGSGPGRRRRRAGKSRRTGRGPGGRAGGGGGAAGPRSTGPGLEGRRCPRSRCRFWQPHFTPPRSRGRSR